jgi:predicted ribosomally synthesized peptide with nif11-like leader
MSIASVQQFLQQVRNDPGLQAKLQAISPETKEKALAEVVGIAAATGFAFTAAEYEAAVKEELARQHAAGELRGEQLERVAGGAAFSVWGVMACSNPCGAV